MSQLDVTTRPTSDAVEVLTVYSGDIRDAVIFVRESVALMGAYGLTEINTSYEGKTSKTTVRAVK